MTLNEKSLFKEEQRFNQWWIWLLVIIIEGVMVWALLIPMIRVWGLGETVDDIRPDDLGVLVLFATVFIVESLVVVLIVTMRLMTDVRPDGVSVQFFPLHRKPRFFAKQAIVSYEALTYRPILDYGGWGIRYGRRGKAYNVRGNRGVRFEFVEGRPLLIGSQNPEAFEAALREMKGQSGYFG